MCTLKAARWHKDPRVAYALSVLLNVPPQRFQWPDWLAYDDGAAKSDCARLQILPSDFFGWRYGSAQSLPGPILQRINGVPLLYGAPSVERAGQSLVIRADVIASTYFLLTRYEEWVRRDVRDAHGRFPGKESLPYRAGFIDRPVVEEYGQLLRTWAREVGIHLPAAKRRFSVLLTHDVDTLGINPSPLQPLRSLASGLVGRQPMGAAVRRAASGLGLGRDPLDNLDDVVRVDGRLTDRLGPDRCRSVYFFMAGGRAAPDGAYDIRTPKARKALDGVLNAGCDLGLHASYEAGQRPELIDRERATLEEVAGVPIYKNRHHYLTLREPEDAEPLAAAGITWDASLGYADLPGFRLGVCRPVPLFDPIRCKPVGIEEHPLIVMDCTLSHETYMNLGEEAAFDHVCKLADATFRHQGEFVVLWHNTVLAPTDPGYHRRLYPRVLDYLAGLLRRA